jgi:L-ascorbate metabolism protein UlaG (beta-lactamase superfamily)
LIGRWRRWSSVLLAGLIAVSALAASPPETSQAQSGTVRVEWLGWSFFRFTTPGGKVVLTNPWITGNPAAAVSLDDINQADMILVPDGHGDEMGQTVDIAKKTGALVVASGELSTYMLDMGVPAGQVVRFASPGDRVRKDGITVRLVAADHSSGLGTPSQRVSYGGQAASFVITFENGWTVFFQASGAVRSDYAMWGSMYKPDAMIYYMGSNREPKDAAMAVKLLMTDNPNLGVLMSHHHGPEIPAGWTSYEEVEGELAALGIGIPITRQVRSAVYEFSK